MHGTSRRIDCPGNTFALTAMAARWFDGLSKEKTDMNNTLIKGMHLLEYLARSDHPVGVTELARAVGLGKSGVHRLLQALVELGFARKDDDKGVYWVTLKLWELGQLVLSRLDLRRAAEAPLHALREATRETVHLSVMEGGQVVYVIRLDSPQPVRLSSEVGRRAPAYCVSTGKAILAFLPPAQQEEVARNLVAQTEHTIVDPQEFMREMARIRAQGYSVSRGEWTVGVWGIGAPILASNGHVLGAISATAPMERFQGKALKKTAELVVATAAAIAKDIDSRSNPASI